VKVAAQNSCSFLCKHHVFALFACMRSDSAWAGWPECLALVWATPRTEVDVNGVQ